MKNDFKDIEIFKGKSLDALFKEIYTKQVYRSVELSNIIETITGLIQDQDSAMLLSSILSSYVEANIKNDDQLIKLGSLIQRFVKDIGKDNAEEMGMLTDAEKKELIESAKKFVDNSYKNTGEQ